MSEHGQNTHTRPTEPRGEAADGTVSRVCVCVPSRLFTGSKQMSPFFTLYRVSCPRVAFINAQGSGSKISYSAPGPVTNSGSASAVSQTRKLPKYRIASVKRIFPYSMVTTSDSISVSISVNKMRFSFSQRQKSLFRGVGVEFLKCWAKCFKLPSCLL